MDGEVDEEVEGVEECGKISGWSRERNSCRKTQAMKYVMGTKKLAKKFARGRE